MAGILGSIAGSFGGAALGTAVVQVGLDTRQLTTGFAKARGEVETGTSAMSSKAAAFGAAFKVGAAVAATALVAFAAKAVMAASDQNEALNKVRVTFGETADAVIAFSDTSASKLGISKTAALEASSAFGQMLKTAGMTEEAAASMSTQLVTLAADMASFNNQDPSEMLERLRSGLAGEAEPLRRFGVFISEARVKTEAYASGIAKVGQELTDAQKVQARFNVIMKDTVDQQGDFQRTIGESLPNQIRALKAEFEDLAADAGQQLLPALLDLVSALRDMLPVLRPVIELFVELIGVLGDVAQALTFAESGFAAHAEKLEKLVSDYQSGKLSVTEMEDALIALRAETGFQTQVTDEYSQELRRVRADTDRWSGAAAQAAARQEALSGETESTTKSIRAQTRAVKEQHDAMLALTDPVFGVIDALRQDRTAEEELEAARHKLAQMTERGKQGTKAYEQAQRDVREAALAAAEAHAGLLGAVADLREEVKEGTLSQRDAKAALREMADAAGLTKAETRLLVKQLDAASRALDRWNRTPFNDKSAQVFIHTVETASRHQLEGLAEGGVLVKAARGVITQGATMVRSNVMAGEGSYSTPFGRGAEGVIPLDDATMNRLGLAIGRHITLVPVVVDVSGQVISTVARMGGRRNPL